MFTLSSIPKKIFIIFSLILTLLLFSNLKVFANPVITNANDVSFTVSWISAAPAMGEVRYGPTTSLGSTAYDVRGPSTSSNIHYVRISNLLPETTYYFDVVTGIIVDNNEGVHYSFTIGPTSDEPPEPDTAFGPVVLPDGSTPANEALAYVTIKDDDALGSSGRSTTLSSLVESGFWNVQLSNARLLDMSSPFDYSFPGDILEISIYAPDGSTGKTTVDIGNDRPAPQIQTDDTCTVEVCDYIDNDCDGLVDEKDAQGCTIYYKDEDQDGYGVTGDSLCLCAPESRYTASQGGDPNDQDPFIIPIAIDMELNAGWSMISLPVIPESLRLSDLFPEAEVVYGFNMGVGYERIQESKNLAVGSGYWILLDQNQRYSLTGQEINSYTLPVENGWYMIGGCSFSARAFVNTGNIAVIYGYVAGAGYQRVLETESLEPGNGYWILFEDIISQGELTVEK